MHLVYTWYVVYRIYLFTVPSDCESCCVAVQGAVMMADYHTDGLELPLLYSYAMVLYGLYTSAPPLLFLYEHRMKLLTILLHYTGMNLPPLLYSYTRYTGMKLRLMLYTVDWHYDPTAVLFRYSTYTTTAVRVLVFI